jgi:hypothetical protein
MSRGSSAIYATLRLLFGLLVPGVRRRAGKPVVVLVLNGGTAATGLKARAGDKREKNQRPTFSQPVAITMLSARALTRMRSKRRETLSQRPAANGGAVAFPLFAPLGWRAGMTHRQARLERRAGSCARRGWTDGATRATELHRAHRIFRPLGTGTLLEGGA